MGKLVNIKPIIKHPYSPDRISIRLQHFRVFELVGMADKGNLIIKKNRLTNVFDKNGETVTSANEWSQKNKSQFIESLIIKFPVPSFYFDGSTRPWRIIDGLKRMNSILSYIRGDYKLTDLEYLENGFNNHFFSELPEYLRMRLLNAELVAHIVDPGTPNEIKFNIFKRINTGNGNLDSQHIRNLYFIGLPTEVLSSLVHDFQLETIIHNSDCSYAEYANRFIAFQLFDYRNYDGNMDTLLAETLQALYELNETNIIEIKTAFKNSLNRAIEMFGDNPFYLPRRNRRTSDINLFDALTWNLNELEEWQYTNLYNHRESLKNKLADMLEQDTSLQHSIIDNPNANPALQTRFDTIKTLFKTYTK